MIRLMKERGEVGVFTEETHALGRIAKIPVIKPIATADYPSADYHPSAAPGLLAAQLQQNPRHAGRHHRSLAR